MKFDAHKGDVGRVFDATGYEIPKPIRGDTETGWVEEYQVSPAGGIIEMADGTILRNAKFYPAPLRIESLENGLLVLHDLQPDCVRG